MDDYWLRCHAFHSICKKRSNENYLKNIDIIYAFLFLLFIVHGTYVLVWNNLLSKQSTSIKLPNKDEKRTIWYLAIAATMFQASQCKIYFFRSFSQNSVVTLITQKWLIYLSTKNTRLDFFLSVEKLTSKGKMWIWQISLLAMASILGIRSDRYLRKGEFSYSLASCCVCSFLPHANVEPKHGFSINKSLLSVHGYSTNDETILALLKDFIIERGGIEKSKVTQNLLRSCERARERYGAFLEQQRKVEEHMKLKRVKEELAKQTKDVV